MQSILRTTNTHLPLPKRKSSRKLSLKTRASKDDGGINWKYVEAVNGRAAMYGTILGGAKGFSQS